MQKRLTSKKPETFSIGSRGILIVYIHSGSRIFFFDLNSSFQYQFVEMYRVEKVVQPFRFSLGKLQQACGRLLQGHSIMMDRVQGRDILLSGSLFGQSNLYFTDDACQWSAQLMRSVCNKSVLNFKTLFQLRK